MARNSVQFWLNGKAVTVHNPDPTQTLLGWLRRTRNLTGCKEGCAEGDCGACTVVTGDPEAQEGNSPWRAINACIAFLPTLDGKAVITVEGLMQNGQLHPVQQALVAHHGSQCGFCTPGFVMSLYAHYRNGGAVDDDTLNDVLAGNLCRCTGYAPIIRAAKAMADYPPVQEYALPKPGSREMLTLDHTSPLDGARRRYFAPRTVDALAALCLQEKDAVLLAGGTDAGLWVTKQHKSLPVLVDVGRVEGFAAIERRKNGLHVGAGARYEDARAALASLHPLLGELVRRIGSQQVRNAGTIGGNIANGSPIGDMPPALMALGAQLILRKGGRRRRIPLENFFIAYGRQDRQDGEFVEAIFVPYPEPGTRFAVYKVSKRFDQDISALCGAFAVTVDRGAVTKARLAYGGMAATPKRAARAEAALLGQAWSEAALRRAMAALQEDFTPLSDMRASAAYRMACAQNLLYKFWLGEMAPYLARQVAHG